MVRRSHVLLVLGTVLMIAPSAAAQPPLADADLHLDTGSAFVDLCGSDGSDRAVVGLEGLYEWDAGGVAWEDTQITLAVHAPDGLTAGLSRHVVFADVPPGSVTGGGDHFAADLFLSAGSGDGCRDVLVSVLAEAEENGTIDSASQEIHLLVEVPV